MIVWARWGRVNENCNIYIYIYMNYDNQMNKQPKKQDDIGIWSKSARNTFKL